MIRSRTPVLDSRSAERVLAELLHRGPAYLPEWDPGEGAPGGADLRIFARFMELLVERLNQAPDKNLLAFLDRFGISLIPAQGARAPVVFTPLPDSGNGRIGGGSRLGAKSVNGDPIFFETEESIALAQAQLVEIRTLWPQEDAWADHTRDLTGGREVTLFEPRQPVAHELYLAHDTLFAFNSRATLDVEFTLGSPGSHALSMIWEFWDGEIWQRFRQIDPSDPLASQDGTEGLTRSGVLRLEAECGESKKRWIQGSEAHWIRGRVEPLPPDPGREIAEIDRIRVRSFIQRSAFRWTVEESALEGDPALRVTIQDEDGNPIPDVAVFSVPNIPGVLFAALARQTGEDGTVLFEDLSPDQEYSLGVNAPTLEADYRNVAVEDTALQVTYTLRRGKQPELAFADGTKLDVTKTFHPFGPAPQPGSVFYFSESDLMTKPGATARIWSAVLPPRSGEDAAGLDPRVRWEYWDGRIWRQLPLALESAEPLVPVGSSALGRAASFLDSGMLSAQVPLDLAPTEVNGEKALWFRVVLRSGTYGYLQTLDFTDPDVDVTLVHPVPPALADMRLGFSYRSPWEFPEHCLTLNDFQWEREEGFRWPGNLFAPFRPVEDQTPALYLGFNRPLPNDRVSLFLDLEESEVSGAALVWEAWDGDVWQEVAVSDGTQGLSRPGMVSFLAPRVRDRASATIRNAEGRDVELRDALEAAAFEAGELTLVSAGDHSEAVRLDAVDGTQARLQGSLEETFNGGTLSQAALPRFGRPLDWLRARLEEVVTPTRRRALGFHLNAVWARQVQTIQNELLGSSTGQPALTFFFSQFPILPGEAIEVRELEGARAEVEFPILRDRLQSRGLPEDAIRTVTDPRSGKVEEVWVRWQSQPHLAFSSAEDRHYVLERARGKVAFGDGRRGRIPPVGLNNIRAAEYKTGGGGEGNVEAGAIDQLLSGGTFVQEVRNPRAADGGAGSESIAALPTRGPQTLRHRNRSVSTLDYEALCLEASPGIAAARALPTTTRNGRPAPGWVTVIVVPRSEEALPRPSLELRERVRNHLLSRIPASLAPERLSVIPPDYLPSTLR